LSAKKEAFYIFCSNIFGWHIFNPLPLNILATVKQKTAFPLSQCLTMKKNYSFLNFQINYYKYIIPVIFPYDILAIMCNLFYISVKLISRQATTWFLIPVSFGAFSPQYTWSEDQPVPMVDHNHFVLILDPIIHCIKSCHFICTSYQREQHPTNRKQPAVVSKYFANQ